MKTLFYITAFLVMCLACNKDETLTENYRSDSVSWIIGADHSLDTTMVLPESGQNASITVSNYSICPNGDLRITASSGNEILLDTIYHDGDLQYEIANSANKPLNVHSRVVDNGSLILCVWIGQATLKYDYVE